jgi:putative membrane protein
MLSGSVQSSLARASTSAARPTTPAAMIVPDKRMSWYRLLFEYRGSAMSRIRGRLFSVFIVACSVTYAAEELSLTTDLTVTPFTLIGLALGVFLGFRNNASYDRYWEGRRLWGRVVNGARSFARLALHSLEVDAVPGKSPSPSDVRGLQRDAIYRVVAFAHALRMHLRNELGDVAQLAPFLPAFELAQLNVQRNVPMYVLNGVSGVLARARQMGALRSREAVAMEALLTDLTDAQGGCERIRNTPLPWSYTVLIHTIVAVYCFTLPFGLVSTTHVLTPLVVLMIAYAFLGLDAVGDELEEPFGKDYNDLPLESITRTIEVNLRQALGEEDLPALLVPSAERVLS